MLQDKLRLLIAGGETLDVEFLSDDRGPLSDAELVAAAVCMANRAVERPGWVLVGVEQDGRISGARFRHHHRTDVARLRALLAQSTRPALDAVVEVLSLDGRDVIAIEVFPHRGPVGTVEGMYLRRILGGDGRPVCLPMHFHDMQTMQAERGLLDYSAQVLPAAHWSDLDPLELERYRRLIRENPGRSEGRLATLDDLALARDLGVVEGDPPRIRVAGLLLFGREDALRRDLPTHEVAFQLLRGTDLAVNDFFRWPLLRVSEELDARFRALHRETELMLGLVRVGVPDYPPRAYREAVANALIHRDYTRVGAVHVQWHTDRIDVSNPGGFPEGVGLDNFLVTSPRPRNPLLADCFKRAGLVERSARGIDSIFHELLRNGHPPPEYGRSGARDVVASMRGGAPDLRWVRLVVEQERLGAPLGVDALLALRIASRSTRVSVDDVRRATQADAGLAEAVLARLAERELLVSLGDGHYAAGELLRQALELAQPDGRVVARDLDRLEAGVLQQLIAHPRITRAQVAELHGLGPDQAKRLLAGMTERGLLARHGEGRGVYYTAAGADPTPA